VPAIDARYDGQYLDAIDSTGRTVVGLDFSAD
jgi:hypothetical protein